MYNEIKNIYVPTVYFDMDGVLADFERASIERGNCWFRTKTS